MLRIHRLVLAAAVALRILGGSSTAGAQTGDAHYVDGVAAFNAGDYAKCVGEMNASMALKPSANAALYLGNAHLKLGQLGLAKTSLERALELDPKTSKRETLVKLITAIEAAQTAKVRVTSEPPGATVYADAETAEAALGKTPVELKLIPGTHEIFVALEGHQTEKRVREFKTGEKVLLDVPLQKQGCVLSLSATPATARARVDGGDPVALPSEERVAIGAHQVSFTAEGFEPRTLDVACETSKPLALAPTLAPVVLTGRVRVSAPPGVVATIDGRPLTAAELAGGLALPVGPHEIAFTGGGRPSVRTPFVVVDGRPVVLEAPPAPDAASRPPRSAPFGTGLYLGLVGGANVPLIEWNLGTDTRGAYPTSSASGGLRVGGQLGARVAVEAEAQWVGLPNRLDDGLGHGLSTDGNVLVHLLGGRWTPVLEAGAGTYQVLASDLGKDSDLRLHAGVGLRGAIGDALAVRLDVRDVVTDGFDRSIGNNLEILLGVERFFWRASGK